MYGGKPHQHCDEWCQGIKRWLREEWAESRAFIRCQSLGRETGTQHQPAVITYSGNFRCLKGLQMKTQIQLRMKRNLPGKWIINQWEELKKNTLGRYKSTKMLYCRSPTALFSLSQNSWWWACLEVVKVWIRMLVKGTFSCIRFMVQICSYRFNNFPSLH